MHLIDKHFFPKDYDFYVVNDGIDRRSSMLRSGRHRRQSSAAQNRVPEEKTRKRSSLLETKTEMPVVYDTTESLQIDTPDGSKVLTPESSQEDTDMEGLSGAMSALKFVPPSVRFGHRGQGRRRDGFSRT